jgi:urease accessory protein
LFSPELAFAHPGSGLAHGMADGFAHPFSGLDHILTMVSVGLLAARQGGRALWLLPLTFLSMMALGGCLGMSGGLVPGVEAGIGASVVFLGLCILSGLPIPLPFAVMLVGVFAVFHGHAHGTEMPATVAGLSYGLSFLAATAILHGIGIGLFLALRRRIGPASVPVLRAAGGLIAAAGLALIVGVI